VNVSNPQFAPDTACTAEIIADRNTTTARRVWQVTNVVDHFLLHSFTDSVMTCGCHGESH